MGKEKERERGEHDQVLGMKKEEMHVFVRRYLCVKLTGDTFCSFLCQNDPNVNMSGLGDFQL